MTAPGGDPLGLVGRDRVAGYDVARVVARGGTSVVYAATQRSTTRPCALKVLWPADREPDERALVCEAFRTEAHVLAHLRHPAIVSVLEYGAALLPTGEPVAWQALPWLAGGTLAEELAARRGQGGRAPDETLALLRPVFEALAYAHAQHVEQDHGIVHRDLKPANLMRPEPGADLCVVDFGLAKVLAGPEDGVAGSGRTRTRSALAGYSLPYAAPEQVAQHRTGPWTDVHALALLVVEVLVDAAPYDTPDRRGTLGAAVMAAVRPTPRRHGRDVGEWEPVLSRALAHAPNQRYATAGEFLAALTTALPTRGPSAAPRAHARALPVVAKPGAPAGVQSPADPFGLIGQTLDHRYQIHHTVAEGGFGVVYAATHVAMETPVAIKVLKTPAEFNDQARAKWIELFRLEAKVIAKLRHTAIVHVLDFGIATSAQGEPLPWMVLEWLQGTTLATELRARRGHPGRAPTEALALLRPIFEAVMYAHEGPLERDHSVVHRDLKPANVMLVPQPRGGVRATLMDFGIAKIVTPDDARPASGDTRTGGITAFSPHYAAPEQLSGSRTGTWTDVHALALLLSEVVTDRPAYPAGLDMTRLCAAVMAKERPTPDARGVNVGAWEPVLARALALVPEERYQHVREFLEALEAALPYADQQAGGTMPATAPMMAAAPVVAAAVAEPLPIPTTLRAGVRDVQPRTPARRAALWAFALTAVGIVAAGSLLVRARRSGPRPAILPITAPPPSIARSTARTPAPAAPVSTAPAPPPRTTDTQLEPAAVLTTEPVIATPPSPPVARSEADDATSAARLVPPSPSTIAPHAPRVSGPRVAQPVHRAPPWPAAPPATPPPGRSAAYGVPLQ